MTLGVDYSFARPGAAAIKDAGFKFVCRYLASDSGKRISASEKDDILNNGLSLVLVFEDYADPRHNFNGNPTDTGADDARVALQQANAIGFPSDRPIYFAVDYDASEADQAWIDDYLRGAASVLGASRVGVYGGYYVVKRCLDNGTASYAWQAVAWSGGQVDPRANIYQNGQTALGGGADVDEARKDDFGQWPFDGIINDMTKEQAQELALYIRLLSFESVDEANSHSDDDVKHMLADPGYAGAIAKAVYSGEWQVPAWKSNHYDELAKKLDDLGHTTPTPPEPTPTPTPVPTPTAPSSPAPIDTSSIGAFFNSIWNRLLGKK